MHPTSFKISAVRTECLDYFIPFVEIFSIVHSEVTQFQVCYFNRLNFELTKNSSFQALIYTLSVIYSLEPVMTVFVFIPTL